MHDREYSNKSMLNRWADILDKATELQKQMTTASWNLPEGLSDEQVNSFENLRKLSNEAIDKTISFVTFWMAHLEDLEDGMTVDKVSQKEDQDMTLQM